MPKVVEAVRGDLGDRDMPEGVSSLEYVFMRRISRLTDEEREKLMRCMSVVAEKGSCPKGHNGSTLTLPYGEPLLSVVG